MVGITSSINSNAKISSTALKAAADQPASNISNVFTVTTTPEGYQVSGESQYVFEMDMYLSTLDKDAQEKAIYYLSNSNNPLHAKALAQFNKSQDVRKQFTDDVIQSIRVQREAAYEKSLKASVRDSALGSEIAVIPNSTDIFRLDGKKNYYPYQATTANTATRAQLDALEANSPSRLNIQEKANIFGTVRNALYASNNVLQSFDDVLNFNYMLEKANTTIDHINAPEDLKSKLKDILNQALKDQNNNQTNYSEGIKKYEDDARVGTEVKENIHMATAAQDYNKNLQAILKTTNISVLNAGSVMTGLLSSHTDLIQFSPNKINDALAFYQKDFDVFDDFIKNGYRPPEEKRIEFDQAPIKEGHNYALKVIEEIQNYIS